MKNIGMPKYGIIENGIFGTRIVSGIVTGIQKISLYTNYHLGKTNGGLLKLLII